MCCRELRIYEVTLYTKTGCAISAQPSLAQRDPRPLVVLIPVVGQDYRLRVLDDILDRRQPNHDDGCQDAECSGKRLSDRAEGVVEHVLAHRPPPFGPRGSTVSGRQTNLCIIG